MWTVTEKSGLELAATNMSLAKQGAYDIKSWVLMEAGFANKDNKSQYNWMFQLKSDKLVPFFSTEIG